LPLFFIKGVSQYGTSFGLFAISIIGMTFIIGAIRKITGSVFLCILFHSMANAGYSTFIILRTLINNIIFSVVLTVISIMAVLLKEYSDYWKKIIS